MAVSSRSIIVVVLSMFALGLMAWAAPSTLAVITLTSLAWLGIIAWVFYR
jgi:hypothetical protein